MFVVIDYYSRYYEAEVTTSTTTRRMIELLDKMFTQHGLPLTITSDNGPQFRSDEFGKFLTENGITHRKCTPLWAQANGEVERQNRSMLKALKIAHAQGKNWRKELNTYLRAYRTTPHTTTGKPPGEVFFGRSIRTKLPEIRETVPNDGELRDRDWEKKIQAKTYADTRRGATISDINPGDTVLLKQKKVDKLTTGFSPRPHMVIERKGNSVVIETPEKKQYKRNITEVKKFITGEDTRGNLQTSTRQPSDTSEQTSVNHPIDNGVTEETTVSPPEGEQFCHDRGRPPRQRRAPDRFGDWI